MNRNQVIKPSAISPQAGGWSSAQGIGQMNSYYGSGDATKAFRRGGDNGNSVRAGVLALNLAGGLTGNATGLGFRVAR